MCRLYLQPPVQVQTVSLARLLERWFCIRYKYIIMLNYIYFWSRYVRFYYVVDVSLHSPVY